MIICFWVVPLVVEEYSCLLEPNLLNDKVWIIQLSIYLCPAFVHKKSFDFGGNGNLRTTSTLRNLPYSIYWFWPYIFVRPVGFTTGHVLKYPCHYQHAKKRKKQKKYGGLVSHMLGLLVIPILVSFVDLTLLMQNYGKVKGLNMPLILNF